MFSKFRTRPNPLKNRMHRTIKFFLLFSKDSLKKASISLLNEIKRVMALRPTNMDKFKPNLSTK